MLNTIKKAVAGMAAVALLLPVMADAATVNINLKNKNGQDLTDFTGMELKILDTVGSVAYGPSTPTQASISVPDLVSGESYTIVLKRALSFQDGNGQTKNFDVFSTKSLRFENNEESVVKNFLLTDAFISNPNIRLSGVSECAGQTVNNDLLIKFHPVESSTRNFADPADFILKKTGPITFDANGNVANVLGITGSIPVGAYKYQLKFDGANPPCLANWTDTSLNPVRANVNSFINLNAGLTKPLKVTANMKIRSVNGADAVFDGSSINLVIKDKATNNTVYTKAIANPSGASLSDISDVLPQGTYTVFATLTKNGLTNEVSRDVNLNSGPRSVNLTFREPVAYEVSMKVIDGRTGANITSGQMVIKDRDDNVIETVTLNGAPVVKNLIAGKQYKLVVTSNGYNERKMSLFPREARTVEVTLSKATQ